MNERWICVALTTLCLAGCEKAQLDEEVRQLCAKDGGVKVYERVTLPADKFDEHGFINFFHASAKAPLGNDYLFEKQIYYYRRGNPEMWRTYYRVVRNADGKLLGEAVRYSRRGGDMPGPWHDSSFACPKDADEIVLLKGVFIKGR